MDEERGENKKLDDVEKAALAASTTIVIFFVVYWAIQIQSTYSLLAMAYEW